MQYLFIMINKITLSYPLRIIGIIMLLLGTRWVIHDEPWMLDEVANVERLEMTFEKLFEPEINKTLPDYLRQIYRFFGFWVMIIGMFITSFSSYNAISNKEIGIKLFVIIGLMMSFGLYLGYTLIPSSHFISLIWVLIIFYLISLYSFYNLILNK